MEEEKSFFSVEGELDRYPDLYSATPEKTGLREIPVTFIGSIYPLSRREAIWGRSFFLSLLLRKVNVGEIRRRSKRKQLPLGSALLSGISTPGTRRSF